MEELPGMKEALERLPQEVHDARWFRIKRVRGWLAFLWLLARVFFFEHCDDLGAVTVEHCFPPLTHNRNLCLHLRYLCRR